LTCSEVNVLITALSPLVSISLPCDGGAALPLLREDKAAKGCEGNIGILQDATKINAPLGAHPRLQAHLISFLSLSSNLNRRMVHCSSKMGMLHQSPRQRPCFTLNWRCSFCYCGAQKCFPQSQGGAQTSPPSSPPPCASAPQESEQEHTAHLGSRTPSQEVVGLVATSAAIRRRERREMARLSKGKAWKIQKTVSQRRFTLQSVSKSFQATNL
jgi:hypothetical protein